MTAEEQEEQEERRAMARVLEQKEREERASAKRDEKDQKLCRCSDGKWKELLSEQKEGLVRKAKERAKERATEETRKKGLTAYDLRTTLDELGLDMDGGKNELFARLREYEQRAGRELPAEAKEEEVDAQALKYCSRRQLAQKVKQEEAKAKEEAKERERERAKERARREWAKERDHGVWAKEADGRAGEGEGEGALKEQAKVCFWRQRQRRRSPRLRGLHASRQNSGAPTISSRPNHSV
jgi:hypothetical protein